MIGLVKSGPGLAGVGLLQLPEPVAGPREAVIDIIASGVGRLDLQIIADERPWRGPVVLGREFTGIVSSVGSAEDQSWCGVRVVADTHVRGCGHCVACEQGSERICGDQEAVGSIHDGGFADRVVVQIENLHRVPPNVGEFGAAIAEPLASVVRGVAVVPSDRVLVVGPGTKGFLAAQVARAAGAHVTVAGLPRDEYRLEAIEDLGIETILHRAQPESFDVVIESSGSSRGATAALDAVRPGGRYVSLGFFGRDVTIPFDQVLFKELTVTGGSVPTTESWDRALRLLKVGAVNLDAVISEVVSLEHWADALDAVRDGIGMKILIDPRSHLRGRGMA